MQNGSDAGGGGGDGDGDGDGNTEQINNGPCGKGAFPAKDYDNSYIFCPSTDPKDDCIPFSKAEGYTSLPNRVLILDEPNLAAIECATSVGDLTVAELANLTDLSELGNIKRAAQLNVVNNMALTSLAGLDALTWVGELQIKNNGALKSLVGLPDGLEIETLIIESSDGLTSLVGLEKITITDSLLISDNENLSQCAVEALKARFPDLNLYYLDDNRGTAACK
jgi:hypothetical protein